MPLASWIWSAGLACTLAAEQAPAPQPAAPAPRIEYFALVEEPRRIVGLARLLRRDMPGPAGALVHLELELEHWSLATTVRLTEAHGVHEGVARHELVWREQYGQPGQPAGRCLVARWTPRGEFETHQWGALEPLRRERELVRRPLFPLEIWEAERWGWRADGERYDPRSDALESSRRSPLGAILSRRCAGVREALGDATPELARLWSGPLLTGFRFAPGSPWALAISEQRWSELRSSRKAENASEIGWVTNPLPTRDVPDDYSGALAGRPLPR